MLCLHPLWQVKELQQLLLQLGGSPDSLYSAAAESAASPEMVRRRLPRPLSSLQIEMWHMNRCWHQDLASRLPNFQGSESVSCFRTRHVPQIEAAQRGLARVLGACFRLARLEGPELEELIEASIEGCQLFPIGTPFWDGQWKT